jgi:hypothetical protein
LSSGSACTHGNSAEHYNNTCNNTHEDIRNFTNDNDDEPNHSTDHQQQQQQQHDTVAK